MTRILVTGDTFGVSQLIRHLPAQCIAGIMGAANRPQYHAELARISSSLRVPMVIQRRPDASDYGNMLSEIRSLAPDLIWVNSYSMILRPNVLDISRFGALNIHGGLLPQYRGCNPTQWAILNGEHEVGVTLHEISDGIDEGKIIAQRRVPLFFSDTWKSAGHRISDATDQLIQEHLPAILALQWESFAQDENLARCNRRRRPEDGLFDWTQPAIEIYNLVRALVAPLPGAFYLGDGREKVTVGEHLSLAEIVNQKLDRTGAGSNPCTNLRIRAADRSSEQPPSPVAFDRAGNEIDESACLCLRIEETAGSAPAAFVQFHEINQRDGSASLDIRTNCTSLSPSEMFRMITEFGKSELKLTKFFSENFETPELRREA